MTYASGPFSRGSRRMGPFQPIDYAPHAGSPAVVTFFNSVYAWMTAGLALTGLVAWQVSQHIDWAVKIFHGPVFILLVIAQFACVIAISAAIQRIPATIATVLFLVYAALNGLTLSGFFIVYTHASLLGAFAATAGMFGVMSAYGMLTKSDLSGLGKILFMGLIGLVIATVVNLFLHSSGLQWLLTYAGIAIFTGLTAYDTNRLRQVAISTAGDAAMAARLSISGALMLYLDFLNLFIYMVQIMGDRRQ
jgi:uncharacterized protein